MQALNSINNQYDNSNIDKSMPFHFVNQLWHRFSGSRVLVHQEYCSWSLYIREELWVHYARSIRIKRSPMTSHSFVKQQLRCQSYTMEVSRASAGSYFLQKSGSDMTYVISSGSLCLLASSVVLPCVYIFRGKQKHLDRP